MSLGLGVMINMLCGNEETVNAVTRSLNKVITDLRIDSDDLKFTFEDGTVLRLYDGGQSCCEHRYIKCDDKLSDYVGQKLVNVEIKKYDNIGDDGYSEHEVQFVEIQTDKDFLTIVNHNEHTGYYGGFSLQAR